MHDTQRSEHGIDILDNLLDYRPNQHIQLTGKKAALYNMNLKNMIL